MKTVVLLTVSLMAAFIFDAIFGGIAGGILPPMAVVVGLYWFWRLTMGNRLVLAIVLGLIIDTIGFLTPGASTLVLVGLAFLCEPMKAFFSNNESRTVVAMNMIILLVLFRILVFPAAYMISWVSGA